MNKANIAEVIQEGEMKIEMNREMKTGIKKMDKKDPRMSGVIFYLYHRS